jgi:hypothetical protein
VRCAWIGWSACACLIASHALAQAAVIERTPQDVEVAHELSALVDVPITEREEAGPRPLGAILQDAQSWPERYVVVIDRDNASVLVLRPDDGTVFSRVLAPEVMQTAPYAVALTTAELLHWLHAEPPAAVETRAAELHPRRTSLLSAAGLAELDVRASPGYDVSLARLALGAELQFARRKPWWFALGARVTTPATRTRRLDAASVRAGIERIEYSSTDAALQVSAGHGLGGAALIGTVSAGLSIDSVEARSASGTVAGDDDRLVGFVGLGLALRYPLAIGFALALGADAQLALQHVRYRVRGEPVLEEGLFRIASHIGLVWESAFVE